MEGDVVFPRDEPSRYLPKMKYQVFGPKNIQTSNNTQTQKVVLMHLCAYVCATIIIEKKVINLGENGE